ncbi:hypothetical protein QFZ77_007469 [Paenibacillus sp. V4I3]|uniref:hypothetical protein n=1 Tax=Paenibacillus sp. V4I3 TaxID=3042305 RepID=UPI002781BA08|nr:hypothetical protein [Paenibacillus sp. V4I3]MDQ0878810.1 hypothetical protein [Paenibacillus sp. V4I3]
MDGFWNKAFRWINIIFIPAITILILAITGYRFHKNELETNSPDVIFLVALLFTLIIAGKIRRIITSGSLFMSTTFLNISITAIVVVSVYSQHYFGFKGLLFEAILLVVLVMLLYGLYKIIHKET